MRYWVFITTNGDKDYNNIYVTDDNLTKYKWVNRWGQGGCKSWICVEQLTSYYKEISEEEVFLEML